MTSKILRTHLDGHLDLLKVSNFEPANLVWRNTNLEFDWPWKKKRSKVSFGKIEKKSVGLLNPKTNLKASKNAPRSIFLLELNIISMYVLATNNNKAQHQHKVGIASVDGCLKSHQSFLVSLGLHFQADFPWSSLHPSSQYI